MLTTTTLLRGIVLATTALPTAPAGHRTIEKLSTTGGSTSADVYFQCECGAAGRTLATAVDHLRAIADRNAADSEAARRIAARHTAALAHARGANLEGLLERARRCWDVAKSYEAASRLSHLVDAIKNLIDALAERAWVDAIFAHNADTHTERRSWKQTLEGAA